MKRLLSIVTSALRGPMCLSIILVILSSSVQPPLLARLFCVNSTDFAIYRNIVIMLRSSRRRRSAGLYRPPVAVFYPLVRR
ncbi:hypothetical protein B0H12DRAFT_368076 [Mycena haematopus]|nr:hypothetical protein B0H12DRAFT_368076 [Mycena haematopus]